MPRQKAPLWQRYQYASWVLAARTIARKQVLGLPVWAHELNGLPSDVVQALQALEPVRLRYHAPRRARKGQVVIVTLEPPSHVVGFHHVLAAIARHAGCRPATLYVWVAELESAAGKAKRTPAGRRAKRKQSDRDHRQRYHR
jgi:hypothetical protein